MGTVVAIQVEGPGADQAVDRAFGWFHAIEERCSRFDEGSELMQLTKRVGEAVPVSEILFEAVQFALGMAEESDGAFDPTVGRAMEGIGFNREHRTGKIVRTGVVDEEVTYRDVLLDRLRRTIKLRRPLILDLGAVAKGLAVDAAARELRPFRDFAIDAGGDFYFGGHDPSGAAWPVGIRHPCRDGALIEVLRVSDQAVCTSGDYERRIDGSPDRHHLLDPRTQGTSRSLASATVLAPTALLADALSTAAFVLGPIKGLQLIAGAGAEGLLVTPDLERYETAGLRA